jgi:hypothetical protein
MASGYSNACRASWIASSYSIASKREREREREREKETKREGEQVWGQSLFFSSSQVHNFTFQCTVFMFAGSVRRLATAATQASSPPSSSPSSSSQNALLKVGLLVKRNPVILKELTPFEDAYYRYKEDYERGLSKPFNHSFYFKKGSLAEQKWLNAQKVVGSHPSSPSPTRMHDDELSTVLKNLSERTTEEDINGDITSLNRKLQEPLYLVIKTPNSKFWVLPNGDIKTDELLHEVTMHFLSTKF